MQLAMSERQAHEFCAKEKVTISALESLPGGGVRLVCSSGSGAEIVRQKAKSKIMQVEEARKASPRHTALVN
jgi:hypothetical protein